MSNAIDFGWIYFQFHLCQKGHKRWCMSYCFCCLNSLLYVCGPRPPFPSGGLPNVWICALQISGLFCSLLLLSANVEKRGCYCCWQTWFPAWKGRYSLFYCGSAEWNLILFTDTWMQLPPPSGWIQTRPNKTMKPWPTVLSQATRIHFLINSLSDYVLLPDNEHFWITDKCFPTVQLHHSSSFI